MAAASLASRATPENRGSPVSSAVRRARSASRSASTHASKNRRRRAMSAKARPTPPVPMTRIRNATALPVAPLTVKAGRLRQGGREVVAVVAAPGSVGVAVGAGGGRPGLDEVLEPVQVALDAGLG